MIGFIISSLITGGVIILLAYLLPQVNVKNFWTAVLVGILIGFANGALRLVLGTVGFGLNPMNLSIASLLVSTLAIYLVDAIIPGFKIKSFLWTFLFALILAAINALLLNLVTN